MSRGSGRAGWRPALRIAWRDARRARARTALVLVMIALPVAAVSAADVVRSTQEVAGAEALERRIGAGVARVTAYPDEGEVLQGPDPDQYLLTGWDSATGGYVDQDGRAGRTATADEVRSALGGDARLLPFVTGSARVATDGGATDAEAVEVDLRDPLAAGLFELVRGDLPVNATEVVVNGELAGLGPDPGEDLVLADGTERRVVGVVESTSTTGHPIVVGGPGALGGTAVLADGTGSQGPRSWLVEGDPVVWEEVRALNALGASVVSRAVLEDPPPVPPEVAENFGVGQVDEAVVTVAVLVVVMALIEVVLLAGPAFAVSARRQARTLALLAAGGGTPRQMRRVVLAGGLVLGGLAAAVGTLLGVLAGWALVPVLQRFSDSRFGPFDVPWLHLLAIAGFGLVSAFLAAVVPAVIASRQDVVAVLAGRRGDRRPSLRSPVLGLVLVGAGIAGAVWGADRPSQGETAIAASAILSVLGMVLLVPVVVVALAKVSGGLPLSARYAVRDAARHRTRTVPAVAAVAATVAGVVALGIALESDEAENEATYEASLPMGWGITRGAGGDPEDWLPAVQRALPGAEAEVVRGVVEDDPETERFTGLSVRVPGVRAPFGQGWSSTLGSAYLVGEEVPRPLAELLGSAPADLERAERTLRAGGVVVLSDRVPARARARVRVDEGSYDGGEIERSDAQVLRATGLSPGDGFPPAAVVLSPAAAESLGVTVAARAVVVSGTEIGEDEQEAIAEVVAADAVPNGYAEFYVERGYQTDDETLVVQLVLVGLGAVLMLGGTLTATFLALSDARPDLATLSAVGASPRRRRGVAASYALVVGGVGAALGAAVGFVPGIAVSFPLTRGSMNTCPIVESGMCVVEEGASVGPFLEIPWLSIGALVVVLPLLVAGLVWLTARSRLPLVARLD